MKLITLPVLAAALALPAPATAAQPAKSDRAEAVRECRELRNAAKTAANFASLVKAERKSAKATIRSAFQDCVKTRSAAAAKERSAARSAAVEACRAEAGAPGAQKGKPEKGGPKRNAFGQCVAGKARERKAQADAAQRAQSVNPARACRAEQTADRGAFETEYGKARSAFGKCVSSKVKAQEDAPSQS
jgi:hypothetical protein